MQNEQPQAVVEEELWYFKEKDMFTVSTNEYLLMSKLFEGY